MNPRTQSAIFSFNCNQSAMHHPTTILRRTSGCRENYFEKRPECGQVQGMITGLYGFYDRP